MTDETEVRLRDVLPARPEGDPKETGARLAAEDKTEKDAAGFGWYRPADLYALRLGAFQTLLPRYLAEYGLSAEEALEALDLMSGRSVYDVETFKEQDPIGFEELLKVERRYWTAKAVAQSLYVDGLGNIDPTRPVTSDAPADLVEAVRKEAKAVAEQGQGAGFAWLVNGPACVQEEASRYELLVAPYEVSPAQAKAKAKRILAGRPDAVTYLKGRGWGSGALGGNPRKAARQVLADLVRQDGGKVPEDLAISAGRIIVPQAFLALTEPVSRMARRRRRVEPYNDETQIKLAILEEVEESRSQMAGFSTTELRVILGAFASYSKYTDDGRAWPDSIRVDFRSFAADCALDLSSGKNRNDLLKALNTASSKHVNATITFTEDGRRKALLWFGPIIKAVPLVDASTPNANEALEVWRETGVWKGDAPEEIILSIQDIHGFLGSALVLDHTVLHRIDTASKKVRGRSHDIDLLLFWKLFRIGPRQLNSNSKGPNGHPATYINRDQFLQDCQGAEKVTKEKQAGRYKTRIEAPYLKSIEVLVEAGIIFPDWQAGYEARGGKRDVFEVQPWVIKGSNAKKSLPKSRRRISAGRKGR